MEIKIKLVTNWCSGNHLRELWNRMTKNGDFRWNNIVVLPADCPGEDYTVVVNYSQDTLIKPYKSILFYMEPKKHMHQTTCPPEFDEYNPLSEQLLYVYGYGNGGRNNIEWHLSKTYSELLSEPIQKTRILSSVTSGLQYNEGHVLRYNFLSYLDQLDDFHLYSKNVLPFKSYIGPLPYYAKDDGLMPYLYTFCAENCQEDNYFTEKIVDGILAECLCFYWGCPNIDKFIDARAYICVDLRNPEQAIQVIRNAIMNNEWEKRIDIIRREKVRILNELQFFPTLERLLETEIRKFDVWCISDRKINSTGVRYFKNRDDLPWSEEGWKLVVDGYFDNLGDLNTYFKKIPGDAGLVYVNFWHNGVLPEGEIVCLDNQKISGVGAYFIRLPASNLKTYAFNKFSNDCYVLDTGCLVKECGLISNCRNDRNMFNTGRSERINCNCHISFEILYNLFTKKLVHRDARTTLYYELFDELSTVCYYAGRKDVGRMAFEKLIYYWKKGIPETRKGLGDNIGRIIGNAVYYDCPDIVKELELIRQGAHGTKIKIFSDKHYNQIQDMACRDTDYIVVVNYPRENLSLDTYKTILIKTHDGVCGNLLWDDPNPLNFVAVVKASEQDLTDVISKTIFERERQIKFFKDRVDIYCINLNRCPDRYKTTERELLKHGLVANRFEAVDGMTLKFEDLVAQGIVSENMDELIRNSKGYLGIIASLAALWRQISQRDTGKWSLIIEDDIKFHPNFLQLFEQNWDLIPGDADLVYLGFSYDANIYTPVNDNIIKLKQTVSGAFAHAINKTSAQKLLDCHLPLCTAHDTFSHNIFNMYAFKRPSDADKRLVDELYTEYAMTDSVNFVPLHGIVGCRCEKSIVGHLHLKNLHLAKEEQKNRNYDAALTYLLGSLEKINEQNSDYYDLLDQIAVVATRCGRGDLTHMALGKIMASGAYFKIHRDRILDCVDRYCPELMDDCFIIPTCEDKLTMHSHCVRCVLAIRKIYQHIDIIIVNDSLQEKVSDDDLVKFLNDNKVQVVHPEVSGSACAYALNFLYTSKYRHAAIIHDSSELIKPLPFDSDIKFMWHFTSHKQWDYFKIPSSDANIKTHTDEIMVLYASLADSEFKRNFVEFYNQRDKWSGCFGTMFIMSKEFLMLLEEKTKLLSLTNYVRTRRHRMCMESIFAVAVFYTRESLISDVYSLEGDWCVDTKKYNESRDGVIGNYLIKYICGR